MMKPIVWKALAVLAGIFLTGCLVRRCAEPIRSPEVRILAEDTLTAHVNIGSTMYSNVGFPIGFQYTMLTSMADSLDVTLLVAGSKPNPECWQKLAEGELDLVVKKVEDTIGSQYDGCFVGSMPYRNYEMVVRKDEPTLLTVVNTWLGYMHKSPSYLKIQDNFFRSYFLEPYMISGRKASRISPYDDIVKRQSHRLGWDWRLLSAIIYKESRFSMGVTSRRGATGLMQVLKSTAATYGVEDLYNPEENVKAGISHLLQLQRRYEKMGLDSLNVVKFTLAAYNAGESRINDCINFAMSQGKDFSDWDEVAKVIPMMGDPEYYKEADFLRHGKFRGRETIEYVDNVLDIYDMYCTYVRY